MQDRTRTDDEIKTAEQYEALKQKVIALAGRSTDSAETRLLTAPSRGDRSNEINVFVKGTGDQSQDASRAGPLRAIPQMLLVSSTSRAASNAAELQGFGSSPFTPR